jgi:hypothetical protein
LNNRTAHLASGSGPAALLATGILLYVVLVWLARSAANPFDRTLLLAGGNLVLACWLFAPHVRGGQLVLSRKTTAALLGWSIAYSLTYGSFVCLPELIPVWGLVASQACAPFVAVFVSGDHRRDTGSFGRRISLLSPIFFLLGIAFLERRSSPHALIEPFIALALVSLFAFSQSCARIVARNAPSPFWAPPRLAFMNGVILLVFGGVAGRGTVHGDGLILGRNVLLLSFGIFVVQALYLFALTKTPPFLSALLLSAVVPISIFGDSILKTGPSHNRLSLWLSVGFSLTTGFASWVTSDKAKVEMNIGLPLEAK